jgi:putative addiction module component (TIGR02574 family)
MGRVDMDAIRKLTVAERLQLIEEIWDSLVATPDSLPTVEGQRAELRRRLADHESDPSTAIPYEEVKEDLR